MAAFKPAKQPSCRGDEQNPAVMTRRCVTSSEQLGQEVEIRCHATIDAVFLGNTYAAIPRCIGDLCGILAAKAS